MEPEKFSVKPEAEELAVYQDAILYGYQQMDALLADFFVLEKELGADIAFEERAAPEILDAIDRGEVHVHPEVWLPNLKPAVDRYTKETGTLTLGELAVPATQNICVTTATSRLVEIDEVIDLKNPEVAAQFDTVRQAFARSPHQLTNQSTFHVHGITSRNARCHATTENVIDIRSSRQRDKGFFFLAHIDPKLHQLGLERMDSVGFFDTQGFKASHAVRNPRSACNDSHRLCQVGGRREVQIH